MPPEIADEALEQALDRACRTFAAMPYPREAPGQSLFPDTLLRLAARVRECTDMPSVGFGIPFLNRLSGFMDLLSGVDNADAAMAPGAFARLADGLPLDGTGWFPDNGEGWSKSFSASGPDWLLSFATGVARITRKGVVVLDGLPSPDFLLSFARQVWRVEFPLRMDDESKDRLVRDVAARVTDMRDMTDGELLLEMALRMARIAQDAGPDPAG